MLREIIAWLSSFATSMIATLGYPGVFFLMMLESMIVPIPSELVMPFAGYLAGTGELSLFWIVVASAICSIVGSLLSYAMGFYGGRSLVARWGKYLLLDDHDLRWTEKWFKRRGEWTIFVSRFIPVVRHLISIPAGIGKMKLGRFAILTVFGATIWNAILAYAGFLLGQRWEAVRGTMEYISVPVAALLVVAGCYVIYRHAARHFKNAQKR